MKTLEEMIEVMTAFKDGKKIEDKSLYFIDDEWKQVKNPNWNWKDFDFRIAGESKYRPYADTEEMINDFCNRFHVTRTNFGEPFIWVKDKVVNFEKRLIISFEASVISVYDCYYSLAEVFDNFTYLDGSPCGMKVEE